MKRTLDQFDFDSSFEHNYNVQFTEPLYLHNEDGGRSPIYSLSPIKNNRPAPSRLDTFIRKYRISGSPDDYVVFNSMNPCSRNESEPGDIRVNRRYIASLELIC